MIMHLSSLNLNIVVVKGTILNATILSSLQFIPFVKIMINFMVKALIILWSFILAVEEQQLNHTVKLFVSAEVPFLFGIFYHPQNLNVSTSVVSRCLTAFSICVWDGAKRVWWHSHYRVVSACHNFHGVLIGKISTTLIYVHSVCYTAFLSNYPIVSKA